MPKICAQRLALGLTALSLMASGSALANVPLEGLEIVGTPDKLHVLLKSHQLIPARVISQRSDEVVLELSGIDTKNPVMTQFSGQNRISHVSMQALSPDHMRIVLRGEAIPEADIAFKPVQAPPAEALFQYEQPAREVRSITPSASAVKPQAKKPVKPTEATPLIADGVIKPVPVKKYASAPTSNMMDAPPAMPKPLPPEAHVEATSSTDPYEPLLSALNGDPAAEARNNTAKPVSMAAVADSRKALDGLNWLQTIAPSLLGGMLMALGGGGLWWFLKRRPSQPPVLDDADDWMETVEPPRRVKRQASRPEADVFGLSALNRRNDIPTQPPVNRQALRHYQQQAMAQTAKPSSFPAASPSRAETGSARTAVDRLSRMNQTDDPLTQAEVRRSATAKQRRVDAFEPPRVAARTTPPQSGSAPQRNGVRESLEQLQSGKAGLPANPEVLNFLKSVADYMDKQPRR